MYPIGWDNREVRESCGKGANVYNLGEYSSPVFGTRIPRSDTNDTVSVEWQSGT